MEENSNHSKRVKQKNSQHGNKTTDDEPRYASRDSATDPGGEVRGETVCVHPSSLVLIPTNGPPALPASRSPSLAMIKTCTARRGTSTQKPSPAARWREPTSSDEMAAGGSERTACILLLFPDNISIIMQEKVETRRANLPPALLFFSVFIKMNWFPGPVSLKPAVIET